MHLYLLHGHRIQESLKDEEIRISMDGKGRALDNIYVERLWRSLKYENIYIKKYDDASECKAGINNYFNFYNQTRFHQSLDYFTPDQIYFDDEKYQGIKKAA